MSEKGLTHNVPAREILARKAKKLGEKGEFFLASDGSSSTAIKWLSDKAKARFQGQEGILENELSKELHEQIIWPVIKELKREVREKMGLILDRLHFPQQNGVNKNTVPEVDHKGVMLPFAAAARDQGFTLFSKGDGGGPEINHRITGDNTQVWEGMQQKPDGLKTHFFHDGKSTFKTTEAARAAGTQGSGAMIEGIIPMPEPDVEFNTSLGAEKVKSSYKKYYEILMKNLKEIYPDFTEKQLGALIGTKLGFVEDGQFVGGPKDFSSKELIEKTAKATAELIKEVREEFGIAFFRLLSGGRPLEYSLSVANRVNQILAKDSIHVGTSFSSAIFAKVLETADVTLENGKIVFGGRTAAQKELEEIIHECFDASQGKLENAA